MKITGRTHPGQVRPSNQDAVDFDVQRGVAVLAAQLVDAAVVAGGYDNVSLVLVQV